MQKLTPKKANTIILSSLLSIGLATGIFFIQQSVQTKSHDQYVAQNEKLISAHLAEGDYACCLTKPCKSCLHLSPYHGEGMTCTCLEEVVTGVAPCGECVGGILAGRGNEFLDKYFARSIAEGVGMQHLNTLRRIIKEKYGTTITDQL